MTHMISITRNSTSKAARSFKPYISMRTYFDGSIQFLHLFWYYIIIFTRRFTIVDNKFDCTFY